MSNVAGHRTSNLSTRPNRIMPTEAAGDSHPRASGGTNAAPGTPQIADGDPVPIVRSLTAPLASSVPDGTSALDDPGDTAAHHTPAGATATNEQACSSLREPSSSSRKTHSRRGSELIVRDYASGNESAPPSSRFQVVAVDSPFRLSAHINSTLDSPVVGFEQSGPGPLTISDSPQLPSDPVPAYEPSVVSPRTGPRYVSKSLNDIWQSAQDDHDKRSREADCCQQRSPGAPLWLKLGILFLAVFVLNFAFVFATVAVVERIENYDDGNGESAQGLLSGIIGQADDRSSSTTQAKAAVLSALLTSVPAIVGALYAMKMVRKEAADEKRQHSGRSRNSESHRLDGVVVVV